MPVSVTENELLEALAAAQRPNAEGQTAGEMADATGVSSRKVLQALKALQREGRLRVAQAHRVGIHGKSVPVPVYTILPKKAKR